MNTNSMFTSKSSSTAGVEDNSEDILLTVPDTSHTSLFDTEMTCKKIHLLLKGKNKTLTIIDSSKNHNADCCKR
jgi:hypothetical protein